MSKAVFTLNVGNYRPDIRAMTYPLMQHWAHKIGAEFHEITERKYPDWPPVYEKLQIRELARDGGFEWIIYLDADTLVYPDTPDWTALLPKDTVACYGFDWAPVRSAMDEYFLRNGRMIGWAGWHSIASHWCLDLWTPLEMTPEEAFKRLHPTVRESQRGMPASHLIDDYCLSRNVARFGLKAVSLLGLMKNYSQEATWYWHRYDIPEAQKAEEMKRVLGGGEVVINEDGVRQSVPGWKVPAKMLRGGPWNGGWIPPATGVDQGDGSIHLVKE